MASAQNKLPVGVDNEAVQNQIHEKLAAFEKSTLRVLALAVGILFTVRAVASFFVIPIEEALTVVVPLSISILLSSGILLADKLGQLKVAAIRPITMLLVTLVTFNVFFILHTTGNLNQFFFATLLLAALGLVAPTFATWLVFVVPFTVAYLWSLFILEPAKVPPYVAALIGGGVLSTVAYFVRMPAIRKLTELEVVQSSIAEKLTLSNKAKDQFLANMTHELRTPLTGVIGMIDLMADTELTDLQQYYLSTTRKSSRYLLTVINDILDMAKLEAGKLVINAAPMDAVTLSGDIASLFDMRVKQKGLKLVLRLPDDQSLPVMGDSIRISQILLNLLENALKFTTEGTIAIALEAKVALTSTKLIWRVRDTGPGIEKDRLPMLFDRFQQVDSSRTRAASGTGLGLAIVNDLVELMNGDAGVNSVVGQGSEFWFELQLPTAREQDLSPESTSVLDMRYQQVKPSEYTELVDPETPPLPSEDVTASSIRILFAEDNHINRELIRRFIRREGWHGTAVINGQEAIDTLKANAKGFDIVLMDIQMPVLDGLSALKIIKTEITSPPPIIALTANTLSEDTLEYRQAGFDAIVGKPIDIAVLREVVEKLTSPAKP